jgi:hypothetical protein
VKLKAFAGEDSAFEHVLSQAREAVHAACVDAVAARLNGSTL